ncbi:MAG TPA: NIPSNAP family protein [Verrucomicrobiae bacterium]|nr:NIPSNAP family protein [Verrucomicrobiae bacterium]
MNRRQFIALSGSASLAAVASPTPSEAVGEPAERDFYELRQVSVENQDQKTKVDTFLKEAAIPALNRLGLKPVGVFYPAEGISPIYVLLRHASIESFLTVSQQLAGDQEFLSKGADFINAPASAPAFKRIESSLMRAFKGMPHLETPVTNSGRVFQLRTYESPSAKTGLKKIEMFNDAGEMKLFREVGLNAVFFGQTLVGSKMPNLTYMLVFKDKEEQKAAWGRFGSHPEWKKLSAMPEYSDKAILCGITNLSLVAADYSQI